MRLLCRQVLVLGRRDDYSLIFDSDIFSCLMSCRFLIFANVRIKATTEKVCKGQIIYVAHGVPQGSVVVPLP